MCILNVKVCVEKSVCVYREVYVCVYEKGVWEIDETKSLQLLGCHLSPKSRLFDQILP